MQLYPAPVLTWARVIALLVVMSSAACGAQTASWGDWSSWSECSKRCDVNAVRSRMRVCSSSTQTCNGSKVAFQRCDMTNCGVWSEWSNWSKCVPTCDHVEKTRLRTCLPNNAKADRSLLYCGEPTERVNTSVCAGATIPPTASPQPQVASTVSYFYPMESAAVQYGTALLTCCVRSLLALSLQFVSANTGMRVANSSTTQVLTSVNEVTVIFAPVQVSDGGSYSCKDIVPIGVPSKVIEETKQLDVKPFIGPSSPTIPVPPTNSTTSTSTKVVTTSRPTGSGTNATGTTIVPTSSSSSSSIALIVGPVVGGLLLVIIIVVIIICLCKQKRGDVKTITLPMLQRPSISTQQGQSPAGVPAAHPPQLAVAADQSASAATSEKHKDSEQWQEQENSVKPVDQG